MPYTVTTITLPCGARCVRAEGVGVISKEDADYLMTFIGPKGSMYGVPFLVLTQNMKSISSEARTVFSSGFESGQDQAWVGVVVTSPLIRVTANFIVRVSRYRKTKMFPTEEEAIRWLDERTREDASRSKAT